MSILPKAPNVLDRLVDLFTLSEVCHSANDLRPNALIFAATFAALSLLISTTATSAPSSAKQRAILRQSRTASSDNGYLPFYLQFRFPPFNLKYDVAFRPVGRTNLHVNTF
jgi:hypothetical protein